MSVLVGTSAGLALENSFLDVLSTLFSAHLTSSFITLRLASGCVSRVEGSFHLQAHEMSQHLSWPKVLLLREFPKKF